MIIDREDHVEHRRDIIERRISCVYLAQERQLYCSRILLADNTS